ncbi:MAG: transaldolase family protein, partial [Deinococcales bacterium]
SGRKLEDVISEIIELVRGPVSAEVTAMDKAGMIKQGKELRQISSHVVIKLPTTPDGLAACRALTDEGHPVNMTLCFSMNQALLMARAGATYISPFLGRVDDISWDGMQLIKDIRMMLDTHDLKSQIIAASIRHPMHVHQAALAGAHIGTMPAKTFQMLVKHPLTDAGLEKFNADWEKAKKNQ